MNGSKNYGTFTQWKLYSREKEGAPTLSNSKDGTGEHYAQWNKPGGEGQIPYDLTFNWNLINKRKIFCMAKENSIKMKRESTVWENIFANDTSDKGLISKICEELTRLHSWMGFLEESGLMEGEGSRNKTKQKKPNSP